jgi:hypothetical protein
VDFTDGTTDFGTPELENGYASVTVTNFHAGLDGAGGLTSWDDGIAVNYSGDTTYAPSYGGVTEEVELAPSTTTVTAANGSTTYGQTASFTATVAPCGVDGPTPTGSVDFVDEATEQDLGTYTLDGGSATISTSDLGAGWHGISAWYYGDGNYQVSGAYVWAVDNVQQAPTTVTLAVNPTSSDAGQTVKFTATVSASSSSMAQPTGSVDFYDYFDDQVTDLGDATLAANGRANFYISDLPVGTNTVTAVYDGDENYAAGTPPSTSEFTAGGLHAATIYADDGGGGGGSSDGGVSNPVDEDVTGGSPTGTLTLLDNNGSPVAAQGSQPASGVVFITPTGGSHAAVNMQVTIPSGCADTVDLDYTSELVVRLNGSTISSGTPVTAGGALYVYAVSASSSVNSDNVTLVDATTSTTLAQVNFTAVSAWLSSITFTNDYQAPIGMKDGYPEEINGVCAATSLSDSGKPVGDTDWSASDPDASHAIAVTMGTSLEATIVVDVQPAKFQYIINSTSWELSNAANYGSYLDSATQPTTSSGGDDTIPVGFTSPLPSMITQLNQEALWSVGTPGGGFSSSVLNTTQEILVTFGKPISGLSVPGTTDQLGTSVTDKRLEAAVSACADLGEGPSQYDVASAIQHWLPSNAFWSNSDVNPSDVNPERAPTTADGYWGLIPLYGSTTNSVYSYCYQFASLEELMLKTLGVQAQREMIFATPESTWITGNANCVPGGSPGATLRRRDPSPSAPRGSQDALILSFGGQMNVAEGAVRVGSCVYTEGAGALVVGTDDESYLVSNPNVACSAELEALVELAELCGNSLNTFQDWALIVGNTPTIEPGDQCEALPYIQPYD